MFLYMRNDRAPKKYLDKGLSPLHACAMAVFDSVKRKFHQCAMDNLYNSAAFCKATYNHTNKVLCHGVTQECKHVQQAEVKNQKEQPLVWRTVKVAVLERDSACPV